MALWLLATLAGLAAAALQYGAHALRPAVAPLALLRALVVSIVSTLLSLLVRDPPRRKAPRRSRHAQPDVIDV